MTRAVSNDRRRGAKPVIRLLRRPVGSTAWFVVALVAAASMVLTGCIGSAGESQGPTVLTPTQAAEQLIVGPLADQVGLGALTASCPDMTAGKGGDVFPCTAATEADRMVLVDATVLPSGQIELATTNVILGSALASFEQSAVDAINKERPDANLSYEAVDCGDSSVVLPDDRMMICSLTDPSTNQVFDMSLTIEDIESRQFRLAVADRPRG